MSKYQGVKFMRKIFKILIFLILIVTFIGCSKYIPLKVESDPPGASIYLDGEFKGVTPKVIHYRYDPNIFPLEFLHEKNLRLVKKGYKSKEIPISVFSEEKKIFLEKQ